MGGFTARIPSGVFAARDVCRSLDLNHKELRRVANRLWYHRNEIRVRNLSRISLKLKTLPAIPKALTNENIICLLHEEDISSKFIMSADEKAEGFNLVQKTKEIMKNLAKAKNTDEIWRIFGQIITETGIGSGCGVYAINSAGEIQNRGRLGIEGTSRYHDWTLPKGEKAQKIYIYNVIADSYNRPTGGAKVQDRNMLRDLRIWHILNREEWPEYGLNREVLKRALDESGLNKLSPGSLELLNSTKMDTLIKQLIGTVNAKLCLTEDQIDDNCSRAYKEFLAQENTADKASMDELEKAYQSTVEKIKAIAKEAIEKAFQDGERVAISRDYLRRQGLNDLFKILNEEEEYSLSIFKQTLHNYAEAIEDIDGDKARYKLKSDQGLPECIRENFYCLISDMGQKPIALVLANNHEQLIKTGKIKHLFEGEEGKKELLVDTLKEINDTLALALELRTDQKELKLNNEQAKKLLDLSNKMNNEIVDLKDRLFQAAIILQSLFDKKVEEGKAEEKNKNEEKIDASIMTINPENPDEMKILAATDKERDSDLSVTASKEGMPIKISGWVKEKRTDIFAARGKVFIGRNKEPMSEADMEGIKLSNPNLFKEIIKITNDVKETFMTVPLLAGDELLGVVNVKGARLNEKDMNILRSAAIIISLAMKNSNQAEELKKALDERIKLFNELEIQARTDELTQLLRRVVLDEALKTAVDKVKKTPNDDLALLMTDIDNFKALNDKYGHKNGDIVLQGVAKAFKDKFGENVCRYGGEEFLTWLPHHTKAEGNMRGEEIREKISKMPIKLLNGKTINVTICIGISSLVEDYKPVEPDALDKFIDKADIALFGAKEHIGVGREKSKNQCWKYTDEVGRQVEETRKNKQDALEKAREKILEASEALKKQRPETVARLLDEIEHQLNILRLHKRM